MEEIRSIVNHLPQRELDIRRRCASDAHFRAVCADYEEAAAALLRWRQAGEEGRHRCEEYEIFLSELEAEILSLLDRPARSSRCM